MGPLPGSQEWTGSRPPSSPDQPAPPCAAGESLHKGSPHSGGCCPQGAGHNSARDAVCSRAGPGPAAPGCSSWSHLHSCTVSLTLRLLICKWGHPLARPATSLPTKGHHSVLPQPDTHRAHRAQSQLRVQAATGWPTCAPTSCPGPLRPTAPTPCDRPLCPGSGPGSNTF